MDVGFVAEQITKWRGSFLRGADGPVLEMKDKMTQAEKVIESIVSNYVVQKTVDGDNESIIK